MDSKFDYSELLNLVKNFLDNYKAAREVFCEKEAADYLRVPLQTLKNYSKKKKISWCLIGKHKIYTKEQLDEFLERKVRFHRDWR